MTSGKKLKFFAEIDMTFKLTSWVARFELEREQWTRYDFNSLLNLMWKFLLSVCGQFAIWKSCSLTFTSTKGGPDQKIHFPLNFKFELLITQTFTPATSDLSWLPTIQLLLPDYNTHKNYVGFNLYLSGHISVQQTTKTFNDSTFTIMNILTV